MNRVVVFFLGVWLLSGCRTSNPTLNLKNPTDYVDGQAKAEQIVWRDYYKQTVKPPVIEWKHDRCPGKEDQGDLIFQDGKCYYGLFYSNQWYIMLAWRGSFHQSAYAHELLHAYLNLKGYYDPDHLRPEWNTMIAEANKRLQQNGL